MPFVVFKLLDQGVLALDAPVFNYLSPTTQQSVIDVLARSDPEVASKTRPESLTIRMLLSHTGGLPNSNNGHVKLGTVPGTQWEYSGVGFQLLQKAVETTTGKLLNQLAKRFVFDPLKMGRSSFIFTPQSDSNMATGTAQDGTPMEPKFMPDAYAAYSLVSTAEDYGKFLATVLSDARMLDQITHSTTTVSEELNFRWGLGWGVERRGSERLIWQWGNNNGYRAFVMGSMQTGDGFVMLTNSANGLPMAKPLAEHLLPGGHPIFGHEYLSS